jgi:hypothetical protein
MPPGSRSVWSSYSPSISSDLGTSCISSEATSSHADFLERDLKSHSVYGETEFWFCSIKVLTIVGLIILGIILTAGGGPDGKAIGFQYWKNPGPFVQYLGIAGSKGRFLGFWAVLS